MHVKPCASNNTQTDRDSTTMEAEKVDVLCISPSSVKTCTAYEDEIYGKCTTRRKQCTEDGKIHSTATFSASVFLTSI